VAEENNLAVQVSALREQDLASIAFAERDVRR
jgi:hypothetical protein